MARFCKNKFTELYQETNLKDLVKVCLEELFNIEAEPNKDFYKVPTISVQNALTLLKQIKVILKGLVELERSIALATKIKDLSKNIMHRMTLSSDSETETYLDLFMVIILKS